MGGPHGFYIVPFLFYHADRHQATTFGAIRAFEGARNPGANKPLMAATEHWKSCPVLPTFRILHPYGGKSLV
jgi:hypothetical protein